MYCGMDGVMNAEKAMVVCSWPKGSDTVLYAQAKLLPSNQDE